MGHYYYVRATAYPVQIRAHQHINVYTDINNLTVNYIRLRWTKV